MRPAPGRLWHKLAESSSVPTCILDGDARSASHNRAWRDLALANGGSPGFVHDGASYADACERMGARLCGAGPGQEPFCSLLSHMLEGRCAEFQLELSGGRGAPTHVLRARACALRGSLGLVALEHVVAGPSEHREREQQALFARLAESMPGVMYQLEVREHARRFLYVSPAVRELFEVSAESVYANADVIWDQVVELHRGSSVGALAQQAADAPRELDFRVRTPSGVEKWIHSVARPHRDASGALSWIGVLSDITARRKAEALLAASEETHRTLFETVAQGVVYQDLEGRITAANPSALRILGLSLDQLQGRTSIDPRWRAICEDGSDFPGHEHPAMVALRTRTPVRDVLLGICRPDETRVWILVNAIPIERDGKLAHVYASFEDITERVELAKELRRQATTDFTTGIANRRSFLTRLEQELERVRRHPKIASAVASLDIDHFKLVNDTFGHSAGDAVLQHFAAILEREVRGSDFVARTGGEEFSILLPETTPEQALSLAERLRRAVLAQPASHQGRELSITVSIGVACIEPADASMDEPLARADLAMYEVKRAGCDAIRFAPRLPALRQLTGQSRSVAVPCARSLSLCVSRSLAPLRGLSLPSSRVPRRALRRTQRSRTCARCTRRTLRSGPRRRCPSASSIAS